VVKDGNDIEARTQMMLATIYGGMGFGNAGVHLPHAMGYPIAGNVRGFHPVDYPRKKPLVPHGMSTALGAPASFRLTAAAKPQRHSGIAEWMGVKTNGSSAESAGEALRTAFIGFMKTLGMPNGLQAVGYSHGDIPALIEGTPEAEATACHLSTAGYGKNHWRRFSKSRWLSGECLLSRTAGRRCIVRGHGDCESVKGIGMSQLPLLDRRGGRDINKSREASTRSGRGGCSNVLFEFEQPPRLCRQWLLRNIFFLAQPPLLSRRGNGLIPFHSQPASHAVMIAVMVVRYATCS
jgi:hypothetical protein